MRIVAVVLLLAGGAVWFATGANRGWSKTSVPVKTLDEVTGIEAISYEKRFLPGMDFLGGIALTAIGLAGLSFFFREKSAQAKTV
jgi:hypothetical protein